MKRKVIEQLLVVFLFTMVLIVFSFAERDSKKLDRLYNTAQTLQKKATAATVKTRPAPAEKGIN